MNILLLSYFFYLIKCTSSVDGARRILEYLDRENKGEAMQNGVLVGALSRKNIRQLDDPAVVKALNDHGLEGKGYCKPFKSCFKFLDEQFGVLYKEGENVVIQHLGEEVCGSIVELVCVPCTNNQIFSMVKIECFEGAKNQDNGEILVDSFSGYMIVKRTNSVIVTTTYNIERKVMLMKNFHDLVNPDTFICINWNCPRLFCSPDDINVPFFPQCEDMVHIMGEVIRFHLDAFVTFLQLPNM